MSFWMSRTGKEITGRADDAFVKDFEIIPNNTMALAKIVSFINDNDNHLEIIWKITSDSFKNREVRQKIKCFNGKPEQIDRALNMLKLIMDLCSFKPTHSNAPTNDDLMRMNGKVCGIKIREYAVPKEDGSGIAAGNFVSEVHSPKEFQCEVGEKMKCDSVVESAFSRYQNNAANQVTDDIPF